MPHKESDDSRVISVRLPNPLVQRLDRVLDGQTTHRRRPATRNAAMRDALQGWLDHQEQLAGLLEPHVLRQQFQATYDSLRSPLDGVPIYRLCPHTEVQAGQVRLQDLSRKLLEAQEAERRRMAHELHDEAGQLLASVHLALESTINGLPPQWRAGFQQVRRQLDAIETQLRRLAHELRPTILDDFGLLPALQALAHRVAERTGLCIRVDSALTGRLAPAVETALYRIVQEGLTNITKHAAATHVDLQLWRDDERIHGRLRDDGVGFAVERGLGQPERRGLGLLGIQERLEALGGTLQISAAPGQGTTLRLTLPAAAPDAMADGALPRDLVTSKGAS